MDVLSEAKHKRLRVNERVAHLASDFIRRGRVAQLEDVLNDADLCRRSIKSAEGRPVIDAHASADHLATAVHSARLR